MLLGDSAVLQSYLYRLVGACTANSTMAGTLASDSAAAAAGAFDKLEEHHIHDLPPSFYYIPNFITAEEEAALLAKARFTPFTT